MFKCCSAVLALNRGVLGSLLWQEAGAPQTRRAGPGELPWAGQRGFHTVAHRVQSRNWPGTGWALVRACWAVGHPLPFLGFTFSSLFVVSLFTTNNIIIWFISAIKLFLSQPKDFTYVSNPPPCAPRFAGAAGWHWVVTWLWTMTAASAQSQGTSKYTTETWGKRGLCHKNHQFCIAHIKSFPGSFPNEVSTYPWNSIIPQVTWQQEMNTFNSSDI